VVSDLKLSATPLLGANKVGPGECDLYLGCDVLVAANDVNLAVASPARTTAVVSTSAVPTGAMVADTGVSFPPLDDTRARIDRAPRGGNVYADARAITTALFGDDQYANTFLVGAAVQAGALPIEPEHLERAIELNGVAVSRNLQAFRRGRQFIADPAGLESACPAAAPPAQPAPEVSEISALVRAGADTELAALVRDRVAELVAYQNAEYARRYVELVEQVRAREQVAVGSADAVTPAVARHLYKVMAYKDEYEVARLSLDPALDRRLREQFGPDVRYSYRLHPPVLRALGLTRKVSLGPWFRPVFRLLYAMRGLRGTRFDPFGRGEVRTTERALVDEYVDAVTEAAQRLTPDNRSLVVELAELPDIVRGYEHVKLANVRRFRERLAMLTTEIARRHQAS
jgi:indolepyruvate ferredoxin oxidoreductase